MLVEMETLTPEDLKSNVFVIRCAPEAEHDLMNHLNAWKHRHPDLADMLNVLVMPPEVQILGIKEVADNLVHAIPKSAEPSDSEKKVGKRGKSTVKLLNPEGDTDDQVQDDR